jgi:hypothetical protein
MARVQVKAAFDKDAGVWFVRDSNVPGLATEAPSLDGLVEKLSVMIPELLNGDDSEAVRFTLTVHVIAGKRTAVA